jgi:hypothetical protein
MAISGWFFSRRKTPPQRKFDPELVLSSALLVLLLRRQAQFDITLRKIVRLIVGIQTARIRQHLKHGRIQHLRLPAQHRSPTRERYAISAYAQHADKSWPVAAYLLFQASHTFRQLII